MIYLNGINSSPSQTFRSALLDGSIVSFTIKFKASNSMWFLDIEYGSFIVKGLRICNNVNLLCQYKNIIPFGLFVQVDDGTEPFLLNDFQTGRVKLNILSSAEVNQLEDVIKETNV
jgi:hypothetical protein